jgi:hypothetical protein
LTIVNSEFDEPTYTGTVPSRKTVSDDVSISILDLTDLPIHEDFDNFPMDVEPSILMSVLFHLSRESYYSLLLLR